MIEKIFATSTVVVASQCASALITKTTYEACAQTVQPEFKTLCKNGNCLADKTTADHSILSSYWEPGMEVRGFQVNNYRLEPNVRFLIGHRDSSLEKMITL